jgi:hypothetical protein
VKKFAFQNSIAALAILFSLVSFAFALAGKLDSPGVAFMGGYPKDAQAKVMAVLTRADCKFLGGHFVNSFTSLRYQGETRALNLFLDDLVKCPGVTVQVGFKKLDDECDWRVSHEAYPNRFHVEVNLNSKRVKIEDVYIPEIKGPMLKKD